MPTNVHVCHEKCTNHCGETEARLLGLHFASRWRYHLHFSLPPPEVSTDSHMNVSPLQTGMALSRGGRGSEQTLSVCVLMLRERLRSCSPAPVCTDSHARRRTLHTDT